MSFPGRAVCPGKALRRWLRLRNQDGAQTVPFSAIARQSLVQKRLQGIDMRNHQLLGLGVMAFGQRLDDGRRTGGLLLLDGRPQGPDLHRPGWRSHRCGSGQALIHCTCFRQAYGTRRPSASFCFKPQLARSAAARSVSHAVSALLTTARYRIVLFLQFNSFNFNNLQKFLLQKISLATHLATHQPYNGFRHIYQPTME